RTRCAQRRGPRGDARGPTYHYPARQDRPRRPRSQGRDPARRDRLPRCSPRRVAGRITEGALFRRVWNRRAQRVGAQRLTARIVADIVKAAASLLQLSAPIRCAPGSSPVPPRLLAHLRRWQARGNIKEHFVEWNGAPIASVKTALKTAVRLAKLPGK